MCLTCTNLLCEDVHKSFPCSIPQHILCWAKKTTWYWNQLTSFIQWLILVKAPAILFILHPKNSLLKYNQLRKKQLHLCYAYNWSFYQLKIFVYKYVCKNLNNSVYHSTKRCLPWGICCQNIIVKESRRHLIMGSFQ